MEKEDLRRIVESDPEAAFTIGCRILGLPDYDERRHADAAFVLAARESGPDMLWRVADAYVQAFDARAADWHRKAVASESDPDAIMVDPGTLPIVVSDGYPSHQDWSIAVRADDDTLARAALRAAGPRLVHVVQTGAELAEDDPVLTTGVLYSPNYVGFAETEPLLWLDCKDAMMPFMARTVIRIVAEELRSAGLASATLFTPDHGRS